MPTNLCISEYWYLQSTSTLYETVNFINIQQYYCETLWLEFKLIFNQDNGKQC